MTRPSTERERAARSAFQQAMASLQTWRHAVRDALAAADAAAGGYAWRCNVCGAHWPSLASNSEGLPGAPPGGRRFGAIPARGNRGGDRG